MFYLDPDTGEIVTVTEEERHLVEDESSEDIPEWQRELRICRNTRKGES